MPRKKLKVLAYLFHLQSFRSLVVVNATAVKQKPEGKQKMLKSDKLSEWRLEMSVYLREVTGTPTRSL